MLDPGCGDRSGLPRVGFQWCCCARACAASGGERLAARCLHAAL